jgi:hypothetical protein
VVGLAGSSTPPDVFCNGVSFFPQQFDQGLDCAV